MESKINLPSRYQIIDLIGSGLSGQVYKTFDSKLQTELAVKVLTNFDQVLSKSFQDEFRILSDLNHPNLVKVHDFGLTPDDIPFFSMDYIKGSDLRTFLNSDDHIVYIKPVIRSILEALDYLHEKGIIHSDLKPENIIVSGDKLESINVFLLDFGLSILNPSDIDTIRGTVKYLAPETLSSSRYSIQSDLFSLGMSLIECITKMDLPRSTEITEDFIRQARGSIGERLSNSGINNPSSISSIIISLVSPAPSMRPESAADCIFLIKDSTTGLAKYVAINENVFSGREKELAVIKDFLISDASTTNTMTLLGKTGVGKKSLIRKGVVNAQLLGFITITFERKSSSKEPVEQFIDSICEHLPVNEAVEFKTSHNKMAFSLSKSSETNSNPIKSDLSNILFDNIVQRLHKLSETKPILISIPDISIFGVNFLLFLKHLIYETNVLNINTKILLSNSTDNIIDDSITENIKELISSRYVIIQEIKPLNPMELKQFLSDIFRVNFFTDREIDLIARSSSGIPLYILKLLDHFYRTDVISFLDHQWFIDHNLFIKSELPDSFDGIATLTLRDLTIPELNILHLIALWDVPIRLPDLYSLYSELEQTEIDSVINSMINENMIFLKNKHIGFTNPSYSIQIMKTIPPPKYQNINLKIGEYLAASGSIDYAKIASHFIASNHIEMSIEYGLRAAEALMQKYNYHDSYALLSDLISLSGCSDSGSYESILSKLAYSETVIALIDEAYEHYNTLINISSSPRMKATYLKQMGRLQEKYLSNKSEAIKHYEYALSISREINDLDLTVDLLISIGYTMTRDDSLELLEEAANLSRERNIDLYTLAISRIIYLQKIKGNIDKMNNNIDELLVVLDVNIISTPVRRAAYYTLYLVTFLNADYNTSRIYLDKMIGLSKKYHDEIEHVFNLTMLGGQHFIQGDYAKMISTLQQGITLAQRFGMLSSCILLNLNLASAHFHLASYDNALASIQESESIAAEENVHNLVLTFFLRPLAIFIYLGRYFDKNIQEYSRKLERGATRNNDSIMLGHNKLWQSRFFYQNLEMENALDHARSALKYFKEADDRDDIVDALTQQAMNEIEAGLQEEANDHLCEARDIFEEINCNYLKPSLLLAEGALAASAGTSRALEILEHALNTSRKMGTRENTWQIQRQLALFHKQTGDLHLAVSYYRDAVSTIKEITESISDDKIKISYLSLPFRKRVFDEVRSF